MMETIGEFCDRMGMDKPKMEVAATELERVKSAINIEIDALRAENARYRAALEAIEVPSLDITDGDPRCNYCFHEHPEHSPFCPTGIAHRALHPEEEE